MFHFKDNKVGINTTPFSTLDINGNTKINGAMNINGNIIPNLNEIYDLGSSDLRWKDIYLSGNTIDLGGTRIQKDTNGGIKITNDEGDTLDGKFNNLVIDGNVDISGNLIVKGSTTTINTTSLVIDDPVITLGTLNTNEMLQNDGYNKGVEFTYFTNEAKKGFFGFDNATNDFIYVKDTSNNLGNIRANIFIGDLSGNANYAINANNASTVTNGVYTIGNQNIGGIKNFTNKLGIGSSVPSKELDISGNINFTGNLFQNSSPYIGSQWTTSSNNIYYDTGNVGIGSSIPSASLDVSGNILIRDGTITKPAIAFTTDTNTGLYRPGGDIIGFVTGGNERMRIDAIGNMGIGSSLPFKELDVSGNINFTGNLFQNSSPYIGSQWTTSNNNIYYNIGNVGIGTSNPSATLDVSGNIRINGYIKNNNPCFSVYKDNGASVYSTLGVVVWNKVINNNQTCYNTSTGFFTAPISGNYYFAYHVLKAASNAISLRLYKNNTAYVDGSWLYSGAETASSSNNAHTSCIVFLSSGETISVNQVGGGFYAGSNYHNGFNGFLIG